MSDPTSNAPLGSLRALWPFVRRHKALFVGWLLALGISSSASLSLPVAFLPPELQPTAAFLNATLNQQLNILPRQKTASAGVRWDFYRNLALKVQYDQVDVDSGSFGTFGNIQPGFQPGSRVRILSATLDFVF